MRILRDQKIDARHMPIEDLSAELPPNAADAVSIVYVVSAFPSEERGRGGVVIEQLRARFSQACIVAVLLTGMLLQPEAVAEVEDLRGADKSATSLGNAVQLCLNMQPQQEQI